MFFFGWGKKRKAWQIDQNKKILAEWDNIHLFFCPVAFNIKWFVIGNNRSEDKQITYDEVKTISSAQPIKINIWQRYGLFFAMAIVLILGLINIYNR